ncbi:MAG: metallophosphoesterase [Myxococcales bacterium]|nr:metallophosphoesterase [Myxococcales bacterium]
MRPTTPGYFRQLGSSTPLVIGFLSGLLLMGAGCGSDAADAAGDTTSSDVSLVDAAAGLDGAGADQTSADANVSDSASDDTQLNADAAVDASEQVDAGPIKTFAIAAIADPHITGTSTTKPNIQRLHATVAWLNANAAAKGIELVLVLGDIGWSGGLKGARAALDKLTVPYLPTLGDNCNFAGDEKTFSDVFGPVYAGLGDKFANLSRAATPTTHGKTGKQVILQNVSFDLHGIHVVGLDVSPRDKKGIVGEMGDLHDYEGGTFPWLQADLAKVAQRPKGSVLIASHIPLHESPGALMGDEIDKLNALAKKTPGLIHASIAGHYHVDAVVDLPLLEYISYVVGAIFVGPLPVHIATVTTQGQTVTWQHDTIYLPGYK